MKRPRSPVLSVFFLACLAAVPATAQTAAGTEVVDTVALYGAPSYLDGHPARNPDGTINVVVEIPAGTNAKWEVSKHDGALRWELRGGRPRVVRYLGYPGNYGMVPSTLLAREAGGDGDPLDVILLGPALDRGAVVAARLLGVLELLDDGEQDDKLLAVTEDSPLAAVRSLEELNERFPGVTSIVETWFANYKGPGEIEIRGYGDRARAEGILAEAARQFARDAAE